MFFGYFERTNIDAEILLFRTGMLEEEIEEEVVTGRRVDFQEMRADSRKSELQFSAALTSN